MSEILDTLDVLHGLEATSLFRYLGTAQPLAGLRDAKLLRTLKAMEAVARSQMEALELLLAERGRTPEPARIAMHFTGMNDVGVAYLLPQLVQGKRVLAEAYAAASKGAIADGASLELQAFLAAGAKMHGAHLATLEAYGTQATR